MVATVYPTNDFGHNCIPSGGDYELFYGLIARSLTKKNRNVSRHSGMKKFIINCTYFSKRMRASTAVT